MRKENKMVIVQIFLACVIAVVTCIISSRSTVALIISAIVAGLLQFFIAIWGLPTLGFFYPGVWFSLIIAGVIGAVIGLFAGKNLTAASVPVVFLIILAIISFFSSCEMIYSDDYRALIGDVKTKTFTEHVPMADARHIRMVPKQTALTLAKKVLGQSKEGTVLGSQLMIDADNGAIQEVQGELWWIFPLDFSGFFEWHNRKTIPGYVRVSAQDPTREAQLIDQDPETGKKFNIRYTRKAYWGFWLDRKVYYKYSTVAREEYTFEVDDNWKPYYVISATYPTIGFSGYKTKGVIIIDPQTGEMELKEGDDIPAWVDRVIPIARAKEQIRWWGDYIHGWLNSIFSKKDVQKPTDYLGTQGADLWFVKQGDKKYWFTGMTSVSATDQSLVGAMMVETRTGKAYYYAMQGTDENGVVETVDASLGADSVRWQPAMPIPYNIYGVATWVVVVISEEGIFQKIALVDINNINTIAVESNLERALQKYRVVLSQRGNEVAPTGVGGIKSVGPARVLRIGNIVLGGEKTFLLFLEGNEEKLFSSSGETKETRLIAIVKQNDMITLRFLETDEPIVPVESVSVKGIELKKSPVQLVYDVQRKVSKKSEDEITSTRNADKDWERLSPTEKRELMKKE